MAIVTFWNGTDEQDIKDKVNQTIEIEKLQKQIEKLAKKMNAEKQFNRQIAIRAEIKDLEQQLYILKGTFNG